MQMMQDRKGQPQPPHVSQNEEGSDFRVFFRMKPSEFLGVLEPVSAHDWWSGIERVFQAICCPKEVKVIFSSYMIKGPTSRWWDIASSYQTSQVIPWDWQHFKANFLEKYYSNILHPQKEHKFQ